MKIFSYKRTFGSIALIAILSLQSFSESRIDSLKSLLSEVTTDSNRGNICYQIAFHTKWTNVDTCNLYLEEAFSIAKEKELEELLSKCLNLKGIVSFNLGNLEDAVLWTDSSAKIHQGRGDLEGEFIALSNLGTYYFHLGEDTLALKIFSEGLIKSTKHEEYGSMGVFASNIGYNYMYKGIYDSALKYFELARIHHLKNSDVDEGAEGVALMLNNIGCVYLEQSMYVEAFEYFKNALDSANKINSNRVINFCRLNIASIYGALEDYENAIDMTAAVIESYIENGFVKQIPEARDDLAFFYLRNEQYDKALEVGQLCLKEKLATNSNSLATVYLVLGETYLAKQKIELGTLYLNKASAEAQKMKNMVTYAKALNLQSTLHIKEGNLELAKRKLLLAYKSIKRHDDPKTMHSIVMNLYLTNKKQNYLEDAINFISEAQLINDTLLSLQRSNDLARSSIEFETQKKELQLALSDEKLKQLSIELQLKEEKITKAKIYWGGGFAFLLLFGTWIYFRIRKKRKTIEQELKNIKLAKENEHLTLIALKQELELKDKKLITQEMAIAEKSEVLEKFKKELISSVDSNSINEVSNSIKILDRTLKTNKKNWDGFKKSFESVHESFFRELTSRHPDLTPKELQLCALFRLNLSMKEVANLLGITADSVRKARYRIRKKLGLNHSEVNLTSFLMKF